MNNKTITYILSVLFVITFSLGAYGYLNKDAANKNDTPKSNVSVVDYNNEQREITAFSDKISSYEFVKANKDYYSGYLVVKIENNQVKVEVQKDGILSADDTTPSVVPYTITDITSPIAVQGLMANDENNLVSIYTLDTNGNLYLSELYANPKTHNGIKTKRLGISGVDSFAVMNINLTDDFIMNQNYVVFKVTDGTYYTDYKFNDVDPYKITKVVEITVPEVSVSEEVIENTDGTENVTDTDNTQVQENTTVEENIQEQGNTVVDENAQTQDNTSVENTNPEVNNNQETQNQEQ